jgi:DnaJ-domain-containing protein 1
MVGLSPYPDNDIYMSKQDIRRKELDDFYAEKTWSQREKERKNKFKDDFMSGKFFEKYEFDQGKEQRAAAADDDIHPIFKIKKSSSQEDFKKEYRKLILKHHPDKSDSDGSFFIKVQEAWQAIA